MKKMIYAALFSVLVAGAALAQNDQTDWKKAVAGYRMALKSDNAGLRYSAMHQLAVLKSKHPEVNIEPVNKDLQKLIDRDKYTSIRLRAELTRAYLNDKTLTDTVKADDFENPAAFYATLMSEVETHYENNIASR